MEDLNPRSGSLLGLTDSDKIDDSVSEWLSLPETIIVMGAGGVGKTSISIMLSLLASNMGKRVGLISIDPARRLAAALGISLNGTLKKVDLASIITNPKGELSACILDQSLVFNEMVQKYAPSKEIADKILANDLYKATSANLSGAIEYMALAKLEEMASSKEFDLIIVDTPPDTHAIDFLSRPNILANFFDKGVIKWLVKPFVLAQRFGASRLLNLGEKLMGSLAKITGVQALSRLAEFVMLMSEVLAGFHEAGRKLSTLLQSNKSTFVVVSSPRMSSLRTTKKLVEALKKMNFPVSGFFFNRVIDQNQFDSADWKNVQLKTEAEYIKLGVEKQKSAIDAFLRSLNTTPQQHFFVIKESRLSIDNPEHLFRLSLSIKKT